ncbi:MAG: class I poly(R)-hydroxyalkanoic acid synthase [Rhodospirillales bacterium]
MPETAEALMSDIALRSWRLAAGVPERLAEAGSGALGQIPDADPLGAGETFMTAAARMAANPLRTAQAQTDLWWDHVELWRRTALRMAGQDVEPLIEPERGDRRFKDPAWSENPFFDSIKQSYLLTARRLCETVNGIDGLDEKTARNLDFFTRQIIDALAPGNFLAANPQALHAAAETNGESLLRGYRNLLEDLETGGGRLRMTMTDENAFEVGRNIAVTPGKVVFRNELMELIQYAPDTPAVHKTPLLITPPWINKYYILDLRPENSFVKWCVGQGHTVFMISWVNPGPEMAQKTFDDYMAEGPLAALDAIESATGERRVNILGYCIGGTLLACTLAWMAAKAKTKGGAKWKDRAASAAFLTALTDFSEPGELGVFTGEAQIAALEKRMNESGGLDGADMAGTFSAMRANDLMWPYLIKNYLLGERPAPFDLLYWNGDSTRMPAAMHSFYLRKMYLENKLSEPGGLTLGGVALDLGAVKTPSYFISAREDHIAPWASTYAATQTFGGEVTFTLADSGHVAGVVNPPAAGKYGHCKNPETPEDPDAWLAGAEHHEGSWWTDWNAWAAPFNGAEVEPRIPGAGGLRALCDAPGEYVKMKT